MTHRRLIVVHLIGAMALAIATPAVASHDPAMGVFVDESSRVTLRADEDALVTHIAPTDYDTDGDIDLLVTRGNLFGNQTERALLLVNDGTGQFRAQNAFAGLPLSDFTHAALGDVNGDSNTDLVLSVNLASARLLFFHAARTRWSDQTSRHLPSGPDGVVISSELFDADGDGDLDLISAIEDPFIVPGAQNRLYLNNGSGTMTDVTATHLPGILDDSSAFAVGDFDADGDNDLITANAGPFVYLENDGTGHFTDGTADHLPAQPSDRDSGRDAVVADFDQDGDLDVIFAISRSDEGPLLWLNDGQGQDFSFTDGTDGRVPTATLSTQALAACDLEGDGDLDLVLANSGAVLFPPTDHLFAGAPERILVNDGTGTFTDVSLDHIPQLLDASQAIACADINGDGFLDIVVGNGVGESMKVYVQTPPGS